MEQIKEVSINGKKIYLKESIFGWRIIYPIKVNGKISWVNLLAGGNWSNLIILFIMVLVILLATYEYAEVVNQLQECLKLNSLIQYNLN